MKKNLNRKKILIPLLGITVLLIPIVIFAATSNCYTFETGVPFFANKNECKSFSGIPSIDYMFTHFFIPIAGILAFVMILIAGFEYATSGGDVNKQKDAQDRIISAIIGLVLLFAFWIIIYTINPDILQTQNLTLEPLSSFSTSTPTVDTLPGFTKICDGPLHKTPLPYSPLVLNSYHCFYIKDSILNDLKSLYANTGKTWVITEACQLLIPNSSTPCYTLYKHQDICHQTGDCVDIALLKSNPTQGEMQSFIDAANQVNLDVLNEYVCTFSDTTGGSFHVVIHRSCTNTDCWSCAKAGEGGTGGSAN
jgi:hypothetical protein